MTPHSQLQPQRECSQFGMELKDQRHKQRVSLRELSKATGYDSSNWSKVERGLISPPLDKLDELLAVLVPEAVDSYKVWFKDLAHIAAKKLPDDIPPENLDHILPACFKKARNLAAEKKDTPTSPTAEKLGEVFDALDKVSADPPDTLQNHLDKDYRKVGTKLIPTSGESRPEMRNTFVPDSKDTDPDEVELKVAELLFRAEHCGKDLDCLGGIKEEIVTLIKEAEVSALKEVWEAGKDPSGIMSIGRIKKHIEWAIASREQHG